MDASAEPVLAGVPLLQYAAVQAALDEEFELDQVLDVEGLEAAAWREAHDLYRAKLATDAATFARFEGRLREAQDRLGRTVAPIDTDLEAWAAFLTVWKQHPEPNELLASNGLRTSDLMRLERNWRKKLAADGKLTTRAAELAARNDETPTSLPSIRPGATLLTPSPAARTKKRRVDEVAAVVSTAAGLRVDLYEFARLCAELRGATP